MIAGPLPDSPDALRDLLNRISASLPVAPFLAIDPGGGGANPLSALLPPLPSPREIGARGQRAARQAGELIGEALKLLGFNTIFAPGLDLTLEETHSAHTFSEDPRQVAQCGWFFVEGLERHKILACAKHFPGLASVVSRLVFDKAGRPPHPPTPLPQRGEGRVNVLALAPLGERVAGRGVLISRGQTGEGVLPIVNSYTGHHTSSSHPAPRSELPVSGRSMAGLWAYDLVPYRELLERLPMVMMSTAAYKAYDFDYPLAAALSKQVVEGLLRTKLRYRGVVIAPELESPTVRGVLDLGRAAAQAVNAGCDLLLVEKEESWQEMERGIEAALESGKLPRERWDQTLKRIHAVKMGMRPARGQFSKTDWQRLVRRFEEFSSAGR